jgi:hypothetical protein
MRRRHDRKKTHREEAYLRFARGDETKLLGLEEDRTLKTVGAKCRDKNGGGIEPMGKIFLLTFPFIGPGRRLGRWRVDMGGEFLC